MYFWNLAKLKRDLQRSSLAPRAALSYLVAFTLLYFVAYLFDRGQPRPDMTPAAWVSSIIVVMSFFVGLVLAYRANGGDRGADFMARYVALTWVIAMRLASLVLVVALMGVVALTTGLRSPDARHVGVQLLGYFIEGGVAVLGTVWIVRSMRDVADASPAS